MLVYNNQEADAALLKRFEEPSWNNPVMRFLNAKGQDVLPRQDGLWAMHEVASRLVAVLKAAQRPVPAWLRLAHDEVQPGPRERLCFSMHCFWEGEARLGALDGVLDTRCAWRDGAEVVEVQYDPRRLPAAKLIETAQTLDCAREVRAHGEELSQQLGIEAVRGPGRPAKASDQLHSLAADRALRLLPLTRLQAVRLNAALARRDSAAIEELLSPAQRRLAAAIGQTQEAQPQKLQDLQRPERLEDLDEYLDRLQARLRD